MRDAVSEPFKAGKLVVEICTVMLTTAKDCMQLLQNRRIVVYGKDLMFHAESLWSVLEVFAWKRRNTESYLEVNEEAAEL